MIRSIIHTMLSQGSVAFMNLAVLLLSTRYLGSEVVGKVSMLILCMAIIQSVNDIYTGPASIFHQAGKSLRTFYLRGVGWTLCCTALLTWTLVRFGVAKDEMMVPLGVLALLSILHYFHVVVVLGREKIRLYNILNLLQPALMVMFLGVQVFVFERRGFAVALYALYASWVITLGASTFCVLLLVRADKNTGSTSFLAVLRTGLVNELGNLAHMLSNRYNYFIIGSVAMVGVYASSTSLMEKVWIIGGSISPIILTRIANRKDDSGNARVTLTLAKLSLGLSLVCTAVVYFLPDSFFTGLLGKDFQEVRSLMLYLAPGVLCISFSTIISHYFSGLGQQRVLLFANLAGLGITLLLSYPLVSRFGMHGAALTASASYAMQALVLCLLFWKTNGLRFADLFRLRLASA